MATVFALSASTPYGFWRRPLHQVTLSLPHPAIPQCVHGRPLYRLMILGRSPLHGSREDLPCSGHLPMTSPPLMPPLVSPIHLIPDRSSGMIRWRQSRTLNPGRKLSSHLRLTPQETRTPATSGTDRTSNATDLCTTCRWPSRDHSPPIHRYSQPPMAPAPSSPRTSSAFQAAYPTPPGTLPRATYLAPPVALLQVSAKATLRFGGPNAPIWVCPCTTYPMPIPQCTGRCTASFRAPQAVSTRIQNG